MRNSESLIQKAVLLKKSKMMLLISWMISFKISKVEHFHAMVVLRKMLKKQRKHLNQQVIKILQIQTKLYSYQRSSQNERHLKYFKVAWRNQQIDHILWWWYCKKWKNNFILCVYYARNDGFIKQQ